MKKLILSALCAAILVSCQKEDSSELTESLKTESMTTFSLPSELNPNNYNTPNNEEEFEVSFIDDGEEVNGTFSFSYTNDELIEITLSSEIYNFIGLDDEMFLTTDWEQTIIDEWEDLDGELPLGKRSFGEWLRHVFIGDPFVGPCLYHSQDHCWDHWLVGVYGCVAEPC